MRSADHELDPVELVCFGSAGIIVDRDDVRIRILAAELLDHALAGNMVRQASKRLRADDIRNAVLDKLYHLCGKEPTFAAGVAAAQDA